MPAQSEQIGQIQEIGVGSILHHLGDVVDKLGAAQIVKGDVDQVGIEQLAQGDLGLAQGIEGPGIDHSGAFQGADVEQGGVIQTVKADLGRGQVGQRHQPGADEILDIDHAAGSEIAVAEQVKVEQVLQAHADQLGIEQVGQGYVGQSQRIQGIRFDQLVLFQVGDGDDRGRVEGIEIDQVEPGQLVQRGGEHVQQTGKDGILAVGNRGADHVHIQQSLVIEFAQVDHVEQVEIVKVEVEVQRQA